MDNILEKLPIRPILRKMDVTQTVSFPLFRYQIVRSTIHNLKDSEGIGFTTRKNSDQKTIEVTRTN